MSDRGLVVVTGGSSGIGRALAESVPFPARVLNLSRRSAPGIEHVATDLSDPAGWDRAVEALAEALGGFDGARVLLVHAAGTLEPMGFAGEVDREGYRRQVLLNSACGQVLGDAFLRLSSGLGARRQIAMLTSGASWSVFEGWSAYGAGKAALDQWVRTVAAEQGLRGGCEVLSIAPGIVETPMQQQIRAMDAHRFPRVEAFRERFAEGGNRTPEDVAPDIWQVLERTDLENGSVIDLIEGPPPAPPIDAS